MNDKFVQSILAFMTSFIASLFELPEHLTNEQFLNLVIQYGQIATVWGGFVFGVVRGWYWLQDRKKRGQKSEVRSQK